MRSLGCGGASGKRPGATGGTTGTGSGGITTKALADFSSWSTANANQVVGLRWQFTGTNIDPNGGLTGCPIDVTINNVKVLP